jgi:hypothetical protein
VYAGLKPTIEAPAKRSVTIGFRATGVLLRSCAVRMRLASDRAVQRISLMLAVSLFPMLTFMGHWPTAVPVPGINLEVRVPLAGAQHQQHGEGTDHEEAHEQHCHGNSVGCSDVPIPAWTSFALIGEAVGLAISGATLWLLALRWWLPNRANAVVPELRPPRRADVAIRAGSRV